MPRSLLLPLLLLLAATACDGAASDRSNGAGDAAADTAGAVADGPSMTGGAAGPGAQRPARVTDSISLEGMREPITLELFRTPPGFPLQFSTYVPEEMAAEVSRSEGEGEGDSAHFYAEFGGQRNELAFVHVYVYPPGTDLNAAMGVVRAYDGGRGVPVSKGIEPLEEPGATERMPWAERAFTFEYQSGGQWYHGTIGLGRHDGRIFHVIRHYPAEYADGFGPRAALILRRWQWRNGTGLM